MLNYHDNNHMKSIKLESSLFINDDFLNQNRYLSVAELVILIKNLNKTYTTICNFIHQQERIKQGYHDSELRHVMFLYESSYNLQLDRIKRFIKLSGQLIQQKKDN